MQLQLHHIEELKSMIKRVLTRIYDVDYYLIDNKVNERSIVFRFGLYFNTLIGKSSFKGLDVDCEYNRNLGEPKRTENYPKGVLPDLLLHRRNSNDENLLVIEFKGHWNKKGRKWDKQKLEDFTSQSGEYAYALGAFIDLWEYEPIIKYYQNYDSPDTGFLTNQLSQ